MKTAKDEARTAVIDDTTGEVVNVYVGTPDDIPDIPGHTKEDVFGMPVSKNWRKGKYNGVDHGFHRVNEHPVFETDANGDFVLDENGNKKQIGTETKIQRVKTDTSGRPVLPDGNPWAETEEVEV